MKRKYTVLVIAIFTVACTLLVFHLTNSTPILPTENSKPQQVTTSTHSSQDLPLTAQVNNSPSVLATPKVEESNAIEKWKDSRLTTIHDNNEYQFYKISLLGKLANSGDIRAMAWAAEKYGIKPDAKSQKWAAISRMKGAVYGSTYALYQQAQHADYLRANANTPEQAKSYLMESMAWHKVGLLRGDPTYYFESISSPLHERLGIALTQKDFEDIDVMSHRIYSSLQAKRVAKGLGDFDNSVPNEVQEYFNQIDPRARGVTGY